MIIKRRQPTIVTGHASNRRQTETTTTASSQARCNQRRRILICLTLIAGYASYTFSSKLTFSRSDSFEYNTRTREGKTKRISNENTTTKDLTPPPLETSNKNKKQPILILHVGPPKTGSTTLQCTLESLRESLEQDGIAYIGRPECLGQNINYEWKKEFRVFATAMVDGFACQKEMIYLDRSAGQQGKQQHLPSQCWDKFVQHLDAYRRSGTNVIFSDEAMSNRLSRKKQYRPALPYPWEALRLALQGWDVRFLVVHRPLYDYLPSVYTEIYKVGPHKRKLQLWHGGGQCPQQNGRVVPRPFDGREQTREITIARLLEPNQQLYPTPAEIYELIQDQNFTVSLVDMKALGDDGEDFIARIICEEIPGARTTCQALKDNNKGETTTQKQLNPSMPLHYDFIAIEACQQGMFNGTLISRQTVRSALKKRQENELSLSANDLPLDCPDEDTLQQLLNASYEHEHRLRGKGWGGSEDEVRHRKAFWSAAYEKNKFCTVNSTKVVHDKDWKEFFQGLEPI